MNLKPSLPKETINHPTHYNESPATCEKCGSRIECITVVRHFNFNLGNVIKYIWRAGLKDRDAHLEDLKKARWYLDDEVKRLEGEINGTTSTPTTGHP